MSPAIDVPDDYVVPKALLRGIRSPCHAVASAPPVYRSFMKDVMIGLRERAAAEFVVPAFVVGYPLYDAADAARWIRSALEDAGYAATVSSERVPAEARDLWPGRSGRATGCLKFPYDDAEYQRALDAPRYTVTVAEA